jgi:hypothetical protein
LAEISDTIGEAKLKAILSSHVMPGTKDSPLWQDNFDQFIAARELLIAQQIVEVTK